MNDIRVRWKLHVLAALLTCFVFMSKHMYDKRAEEAQENREVSSYEKERNCCEDR